MALKPNKNLERFRSMGLLKEGEKYIGAFLARTRIKIMWFFIIGPLAGLTMKQYQIVVTNQRIFFGRLSMMGKLTSVDAFTFDEIEKASFKKGMLTYKIALRFKNGRTLNLDSNHKAIVSMEGFLLDDGLIAQLESAIA